jgi:hypothetical protein
MNMNLWNLAQSGFLSYKETSYILQEILPAFRRIGIIEPCDKKSLPTQSNNTDCRIIQNKHKYDLKQFLV